MTRTLHFVKDDRLHNAVRVWGKPDFYHRRWDMRAVHEIVPGDVAIFATGCESSPVEPHAWDDSANF